MTRWIITPQTAPAVIRACSKCGGQSRFVCSHKFRVNANGNNLDVWLIYKCQTCDTTWNMELFARVKPRQLDSALYQRFLSNDAATAMYYACDASTLGKNKAVVSYDDVAYTVEKASLPKEADGIEIVSEYDLGIRLDKLLSEELDISRMKVKAMLKHGEIAGRDMELSPKTKVKGVLHLYLKARAAEQPRSKAL